MNLHNDRTLFDGDIDTGIRDKEQVDKMHKAKVLMYL